MAIDTAGNFHIVYSGWATNSSVALVHAYNSSGTWRFEQIDSYSDPKVDLAIDGANRLHITYREDFSSIKYATNVTGMWEFSLLDSFRSGIYKNPSIAVDPMGHVTVVYTNQSRGTITLVTGP